MLQRLWAPGCLDITQAFCGSQEYVRAMLQSLWAPGCLDIMQAFCESQEYVRAMLQRLWAPGCLDVAHARCRIQRLCEHEGHVLRASKARTCTDDEWSMSQVIPSHV
eukprot:1149680-Pelagomonas_calceolata.AAC.1